MSEFGGCLGLCPGSLREPPRDIFAKKKGGCGARLGRCVGLGRFAKLVYAEASGHVRSHFLDRRFTGDVLWVSLVAAAEQGRLGAAVGWKCL